MADRRPSIVRRSMTKLKDTSEINIFYKYILFLSNFGFMITGLAMLIVGAYVLSLKDKTVGQFVEFLFDPSCLLCLSGTIAVFCAFLGCYGALRENCLLLKIYYTMLTIMVLVQFFIVVVIFIYYFLDKVPQSLRILPEKQLRKAIKSYRDDMDMQNVIDTMQELLGCCGVSNNMEGYKDWNDNPYFNCTGVTHPIGEQCGVPFSCCLRETGTNINYQCGFESLGPDMVNDVYTRIYTRGCLLAVKEIINQNAMTIVGILFGVLIPQAFFICMAKTFCDQVEEQRFKW